MEQDLVGLFLEFKDNVLSADEDLVKAVAGNGSAGNRARKSLRLAKKQLSALIKASTAHSKAHAAAKKAAKAT